MMPTMVSIIQDNDAVLGRRSFPRRVANYGEHLKRLLSNADYGEHYDEDKSKTNANYGEHSLYKSIDQD